MKTTIYTMSAALLLLVAAFTPARADSDTPKGDDLVTARIHQWPPTAAWFDEPKPLRNESNGSIGLGIGWLGSGWGGPALEGTDFLNPGDPFGVYAGMGYWSTQSANADLEAMAWHLGVAYKATRELHVGIGAEVARASAAVNIDNLHGNADVTTLGPHVFAELGRATGPALRASWGKESSGLSLQWRY